MSDYYYNQLPEEVFLLTTNVFACIPVVWGLWFAVWVCSFKIRGIVVVHLEPACPRLSREKKMLHLKNTILQKWLYLHWLWEHYLIQVTINHVNRRYYVFVFVLQLAFHARVNAVVVCTHNMNIHRLVSHSRNLNTIRAINRTHGHPVDRYSIMAYRWGVGGWVVRILDLSC